MGQWWRANKIMSAKHQARRKHLDSKKRCCSDKGDGEHEGKDHSEGEMEETDASVTTTNAWEASP